MSKTNGLRLVQSSEKYTRCSTDPEIRTIICPDDSKTLTTEVTLKYPFIPPWHDKYLWSGIEPNLHTALMTALCINLDLSYYFLFILLSNLPPWITRQGHAGRLCVFCLQSFSRLFRDEVVVYKGVTPGSGPEPWQWFITRHRARAGWLIRSYSTVCEMKRF